MKKEKQTKRNIVIAGSILTVGIFCFIFLVPMSYDAVQGYTESVPYDTQESYEEMEPYGATEAYTMREPYTTYEPYEEIVNLQNCDSSYDCICLGRSWGGLGACDSCKCIRERTVTKYSEVTKYRTVTKYRPVIKTRTITNHRDVYKERRITGKATLYKQWTGQVDYFSMAE